MTFRGLPKACAAPWDCPSCSGVEFPVPEHRIHISRIAAAPGRHSGHCQHFTLSGTTVMGLNGSTLLLLLLLHCRYLVLHCRCETILKQLSPTDRRGRGRSVGHTRTPNATPHHTIGLRYAKRYDTMCSVRQINCGPAASLIN